MYKLMNRDAVLTFKRLIFQCEAPVCSCYIVGMSAVVHPCVSSLPFHPSRSGVARNFKWEGPRLPFLLLLFCPSPLCSSFLPLPFFLSSPLSLPFFALKVWSPKIRLRGLWERCELPSGVWGGALTEINLVHFSFKRWDLVATVLIFSRE